MGYGIKSYVDGFLVLLGIKSNTILQAKALKIGEAMKDKSREQVRKGLVEGRDSHFVVARIIAHAQKHYDYWERAAVSQVMGIYKVNKGDACAMVSEMCHYSLDKSGI